MKFVYFKGMGQPDYKAFEQFVRGGQNGQPITTIPRNEPGSTANYMHIDLAAFAAAPPAEQVRARESVSRQLT